MDINFELYKIFYHAAQSTSFSLAAQQLHITQSAVSQAIKNLETKLGVNLFFRKNRQLRLTPEGTLLFSHIEQAYNFIRTAELKITELQNLASGEIRIGASDTVCKYFLLPYIEAFTRQYPRVKLQLFNRTTVQLIEILKKGGIDFGIVTLPLEHSAIAVRELATVRDIWVAAPRAGFAHLKEQSVPLNRLCEYPLLLLDSNSATRQNLDHFFRQHGIRLQPELELESIDLLVEFAKLGRGIAHVLKESALTALQTGELFEVRSVPTPPQRKLGTITMKNVPLSRATEQFIGLLQEIKSV